MKSGQISLIIIALTLLCSTLFWIDSVLFAMSPFEIDPSNFQHIKSPREESTQLASLNSMIIKVEGKLRRVKRKLEAKLAFMAKTQLELKTRELKEKRRIRLESELLHVQAAIKRLFIKKKYLARELKAHEKRKDTLGVARSRRRACNNTETTVVSMGEFDTVPDSVTFENLRTINLQGFPGVLLAKTVDFLPSAGAGMVFDPPVVSVSIDFVLVDHQGIGVLPYDCNGKAMHGLGVLGPIDGFNRTLTVKREDDSFGVPGLRFVAPSAVDICSLRVFTLNENLDGGRVTAIAKVSYTCKHSGVHAP